MIHDLHLKQVGPAPRMDVAFAERLNLLTGDNGLGKSFLLDIIWWAMTGTWSGYPAWPDRGAGKASITYHLSGKKGPTKSPVTSAFDYQRQIWPRPAARPPMPGLVVYARVDGGFSVWDPARNYWKTSEVKGVDQPDRPRAYHFDTHSLWNGLQDGSRVLCNGLVRDWKDWQNQPGQGEDSPFNLLRRVLKHLSPGEGEVLKPGPAVRVSLEDVRDFPTLEMPYGPVPVIHASAGMKRILGLAYLLVWTWYEHKQASALLHQEVTDRLVLLLDEVEAHLHPRWQRSILPALLDVTTGLQAALQTQVIATTHSPLVLASVEPYFSEGKDRLFLLELEEQAVALREVPWAKQGDTTNWLVSDVFGLKQARSREAEQAIEAAEAYLRHEDMAAYPPGLRTREGIHEELQRVLPGHDPFWPRWIVKTEDERDDALHTAAGAG
jgi:hypothetical protein